MSDKVYITKNYRDKYTASSKAKLDVERILNSLGYINIGLPTKSFQSKFAGRLWTVLSNFLAFLRMPRNSVVFLQYPVNLIHRQIAVAKKRNNKVILLVHDISGLRECEIPDLSAFNDSDTLIVHTEAMKKWFEARLENKNIKVLEMFDYLGALSENNIINSSQKPSVVFAGNLSKSSFLDKIEYRNINLSLFGPGYSNRNTGIGIEFQGCFPPDELPSRIKSDYGLVWDGNSIETCSGSYGEYLKLIAPHKLSMYISLGLPVIVWSKSAVADFVRDNKIGFAVDRLDILDTLLPSVTVQEYKKMRDNVSKVSSDVLTGQFLARAISDL